MKNGVFWVLTRATRRNNPEDTILHSHRRENLKSYIAWIHLFSSFEYSHGVWRAEHVIEKYRPLGWYLL
jgi:hypothetical protein